MEGEIRSTLKTLGDSTPTRKIEPVSGGDINQSFYVETDQTQYFVKHNKNVPSHFFEIEAKGLQIIRETNTVRVPEVFHFDKPSNEEKAFLVMEWIEPNTASSPEKFGQQLASMHHHSAHQFGYGQPTFVGQLSQPNDWCDTWTDYYSRFRLKKQMKIGVAKGTIRSERQQRLENLISRITDYVPQQPKPSLLHGDLWGGNWMTSMQGDPVLVDPSILYGDHAFELAFTELFGGFPPSFYEQYENHFPLPDYYEETKPIYQLFYLLVHLNIFGESYGTPVDRILKRFTS